MSYLLQQWLWLRNGWSPDQWKIVRTLISAFVAMFLLYCFVCVSWWHTVKQNESLKDEVARLQFEVKYAPDRKAFENEWRHK